MSQYKFSVNSKIGPVFVIIGWDVPLQHFFMSIYQKSEDHPIYDNLLESYPFNLSLDDFQNVLDKFFITEISLIKGSPLYSQLILDRLN